MPVPQRLRGDYRDFLKLIYEEKKSKSPKFSYQALSNKIGVTKSYFKMIFDKKRHMSVDCFFLYANYFKLTEYETQFICFKILAATAKNKDVKQFFTSILLNYGARNVAFNEKISVKNAIDFGESWLSMAIFQLTRFKDFQASATWIQDKLGGPKFATKAKIRMTLTNIQKAGYLLEGNSYKANDEFVIQDTAPWDDDSYKRYGTGLVRTQLSLNLISQTMMTAPCRYHMYAMALSQENADKLTFLYDEFEKMITAILSEEQEVERVMFVSNNVFSISE